MKNEDRRKVYKIFSAFFAISLIPGIIVHIFYIMGIDLDYSILMPINLQKIDVGVFYKKIFGSVTLWPRKPIRMCGMFDEPGFLGTFAAFFLISDNYDLKKVKNIIILIGGIFSFSLAFLIMSIMFLILKRPLMNLLLISMVILISSFILPRESIIKESFNDRVKIVDGEIVGDNRTRDIFEKGFKSFLHSNTSTVLFGKGRNAHLILSKRISTWKQVIYNQGLIGFTLMISFFLINTRKVWYKKEVIAFIIIFLFSIYQRPRILGISYIILFFGGISNLLLEKPENKFSNE